MNNYCLSFLLCIRIGSLYTSHELYTEKHANFSLKSDIHIYA